MSSCLNRAFLLGAPLGLATGCLLYGGLGFWIAGTTGLYVGLVIAAIFAIAGGIVGWRYLQALHRMEQQWHS